jgi:hypothetical protein
VVSIAAAEVARPVRFMNILLGAALAIVPFVYETDLVSTIVSTVSGVSLIALSFRRGPVRERYGDWSRVLV